MCLPNPQAQSIPPPAPKTIYAILQPPPKHAFNKFVFKHISDTRIPTSPQRHNNIYVYSFDNMYTQAIYVASS